MASGRKREVVWTPGCPPVGQSPRRTRSQATQGHPVQATIDEADRVDEAKTKPALWRGGGRGDECRKAGSGHGLFGSPPPKRRGPKPDAFGSAVWLDRPGACSVDDRTVGFVAIIPDCPQADARPAREQPGGYAHFAGRVADPQNSLPIIHAGIHLDFAPSVDRSKGTWTIGIHRGGHRTSHCLNEQYRPHCSSRRPLTPPCADLHRPRGLLGVWLGGTARLALLLAYAGFIRRLFQIAVGPTVPRIWALNHPS